MKNKKSIDINYLKEFYKEDAFIGGTLLELVNPKTNITSLYVLERAIGNGLPIEAVDMEKFNSVPIYGNTVVYSQNDQAVKAGVSSYNNYSFSLKFWLKDNEDFVIKGIDDAGFLDFDMLIHVDFEYLAEKLEEDFGVRFLICSGFPQTETFGNLMMEINKVLAGKHSIIAN
jgi:hypothetical protein